MARNAGTKSRNTGKTVARKLSQRGVAVVSVIVAMAVATASLLWQHGYGAQVLLAGAAVFTGRRLWKSAADALSSRKVLRGAGWAVAAVAVLVALNGSTAAGGPVLGLSLAAALISYLKLSRR